MVSPASRISDSGSCGVIFSAMDTLPASRVLPLGLSDEDAIEKAHILSSKRRGPFDGFEVWDRARFVFKLPPSTDTLAADQPRLPAPVSR